MISVKKYDSSFRPTWNLFNSQAKNGLFLFDRNYLEYHSDRFQDESLMFFDDDELIALLPCSRHGEELRSHGGLTFGGFVVNTKMKQHHMLDCFEELKRYCRESGVASILYKAIPYIFHASPAQEDLYALFWAHAVLERCHVSSTIDLRHPVKMPKGRKAQISRARREGVVISDSTDFCEFIALENAILKDRHGASAVHSAEEITLLASRFPRNIRLVVARRGEELLAGGILYVYPNIVHTQYLANSDVGCEIGALDLMVSELIKEYTGRVDFFDLGTSMAESENGLNNGLIAQKEGFGGRAVMYDAYRLMI